MCKNTSRETAMSRLIKIALFIFLLLPNFTLAHQHHANNRHRHYNYKSDPYFRTQQGWDINPRKAHRTSNCYYYTLYVEGGRGSARIISLPGKNYIQISNGQKEGYVCFDEPATLELGKLSNPNAYVELNIDGIGIFYFDSGDGGSKLINNWYRSYQGL